MEEETVIPKLLKMEEVLEITTLSRAHLQRMVKDGTFPKPLQLAIRRSAWKQTDIQEWIDGLSRTGLN
jgi:prophage regulatory protein